MPASSVCARLAAHVDLARRIVADEHDREPGRTRPAVESRDRRRDAGAQPLGACALPSMSARRPSARSRDPRRISRRCRAVARRSGSRRKHRSRIRMIGETSMPPRFGRMRRIGRSTGSVTRRGSRRAAHHVVARVHDVEGDEPAQDRGGDEQPDIERDHRVDEPQQQERMRSGDPRPGSQAGTRQLTGVDPRA